MSTGNPPTSTSKSDHIIPEKPTGLGGISDQLRKAMRESGLSMKKLAAEAKVAQPIVSRFMSENPSGHRDILMEKTADRLAAYLKLRLVPIEDTSVSEVGAAVKREPTKRGAKKRKS